jgi:hypothetical protein
LIEKSILLQKDWNCNSAEIQGLENSDRSYQDLSSEFQRLYPSAVRAFELIPLMYNRLTLVDKLSHKEACTKIYDDHKHLSGFSQRNIRKFLPLDNPVIPRRVRPSCPKNSCVETNEPEKYSITHTEPVKDSQLRGQTVNEKSLEEGQCLDCLLLSIKIDVLKEALTKATQFTKTDQISTHEIQFTIPKEKYSQLTAAIESSTNSVYVTFDKSGILERAEPEYS